MTDDTADREFNLSGADRILYKSTLQGRLHVHMCMPSTVMEKPRPGIVFFFGGGWSGGSPQQFEPHCLYLASRGMVAMAAEYRVRKRHGTTPFESVADARSAMRFARSHAGRLDIDPTRLAAGGGSAGGHLAACTAHLPGPDDEADDTSVSCRPDALVLFNPVLDTSAKAFAIKENPEQGPALSPIHHVGDNDPPTVVFHGTADTTVPIDTARRYRDAMVKHGNTCVLHEYEGEAHAFFNKGRNNDVYYRKTVFAMDRFLAELGWIDGPPTIEP